MGVKENALREWLLDYAEKEDVSDEEIPTAAEPQSENPQKEEEIVEKQEEKTEEKVKPVMPVFDTPPVLSDRAKEILKRSRKKRKNNDDDDDDSDILQPELFI